MKLRNRITLLIILLIISTGSVLGYFSVSYMSDIVIQQDQDWSASMAKAIAKAITSKTIERDKAGVREILKLIKNTNKQIDYLIVIDFNNEIFTSTFEQQLPVHLTQGLHEALPGSFNRIKIGQQEINDINYPLIEGLDAHLHIGIDVETNSQWLNGLSDRFIGYALLIILFGALLALIISKRLSQPIITLSASLLSYGSGKHEISLPEKSGTREIDHLADSFSQMINERAKLDQQLHLRTSQLNRILEVAPLIFFSCNKDGIFTLSEGAALQSIGLENGQVVGQSLFDVYADFPDIISSASLALTGQSLSNTNQINNLFFETHWSPLTDSNNRVTGLSGVAIDITSQIKALNSLQDFNEELEQKVEERTSMVIEQAALLDQINDAILTTSLNGTIESWNNGATKLFGYDASDILGKEISLLHQQPAQQHFTDVKQHLKTQGNYEFETTLVDNNGRSFNAHVSLTLIVNDNNEPVKMAAYILDITERKQAEEKIINAMRQAEDASRAKSEFLSRMSHELRTPMNAILGFGQLLELNIGNNLGKEELEYNNEILKAGNHLLELINEVLELSRIEAGKLTLSLEDIDITGLIKDTMTLISPVADKDQITLHSNIDITPVFITADLMRIKQVLLNLLSNAVKYNHPNGSVSVTLETNGPLVRIMVSDTGPGIPEHLQHRVFDPFDRLHAETGDTVGTGIGLSISKKLIELMHGSIGFSSVVDQGTVFWVDVPVGNNTAQDMYSDLMRLPHEPATFSHQKTILYVEDNPSNLHLVQKILNTRSDIKLFDAHTVSIAMDLILSYQFDLILLDINLGDDEDGYVLLEKLQAEAGTKNIPVIAISANATDHDIKKGLAAGFDEYITKPINIQRFLGVLDQYLTGDHSDVAD